MEVGSALLIPGGPGAAAASIAQAAQEANTKSQTSQDIMALLAQNNSRNEGRQNHMAGDAANGNVVSADELRKRYKNARKLTAGVAFGNGDGHLGPELRDAVRERNIAKSKKETASAARKKSALRKLCKEVANIRKEQRTQKSSFRFTTTKLKALCRYKKKKGDKKMPTRKSELEARWKKTKDRPSPQVSPANSDVEEDDDVNDESLWDEPEEQSDDEEVFIPSRDRGLAFGSDTDNEDDDEESSDYGG